MTRHGLPRATMRTGGLVTELLASGFDGVSGMARSGFTVKTKCMKLTGNDPGRVHSGGSSNRKVFVVFARIVARPPTCLTGTLLMGAIGPPASSCPFRNARRVAVANHSFWPLVLAPMLA